MTARMDSAVVVIFTFPCAVRMLMRENENVEWVSTCSGDAVQLIQARWNDYHYDYAILLLYLLSLLIIIYCYELQ